MAIRMDPYAAEWAANKRLSDSRRTAALAEQRTRGQLAFEGLMSAMGSKPLATHLEENRDAFRQAIAMMTGGGKMADNILNGLINGTVTPEQLTKQFGMEVTGEAMKAQGAPENTMAALRDLELRDYGRRVDPGESLGDYQQISHIIQNPDYYTPDIVAKARRQYVANQNKAHLGALEANQAMAASQVGVPNRYIPIQADGQVPAQGYSLGVGRPDHGYQEMLAYANMPGYSEGQLARDRAMEGPELTPEELALLEQEEYIARMKRAHIPGQKNEFAPLPPVRAEGKSSVPGMEAYDKATGGQDAHHLAAVGDGEGIVNAYAMGQPGVAEAVKELNEQYPNPAADLAPDNVSIFADGKTIKEEVAEMFKGSDRMGFGREHAEAIMGLSDESTNYGARQQAQRYLDELYAGSPTRRLNAAAIQDVANASGLDPNVIASRLKKSGMTQQEGIYHILKNRFPDRTPSAIQRGVAEVWPRARELGEAAAGSKFVRRGLGAAGALLGPAARVFASMPGGIDDLLMGTEAGAPGGLSAVPTTGDIAPYMDMPQEQMQFDLDPRMSHLASPTTREEALQRYYADQAPQGPVRRPIPGSTVVRADGYVPVMADAGEDRTRGNMRPNSRTTTPMTPDEYYGTQETSPPPAPTGGVPQAAQEAMINQYAESFLNGTMDFYTIPSEIRPQVLQLAQAMKAATEQVQEPVNRATTTDEALAMTGRAGMSYNPSPGFMPTGAGTMMIPEGSTEPAAPAPPAPPQPEGPYNPRYDKLGFEDGGQTTGSTPAEQPSAQPSEQPTTPEETGDASQGQTEDGNIFKGDYVGMFPFMERQYAALAKAAPGMMRMMGMDAFISMYNPEVMMSDPTQALEYAKFVHEQNMDLANLEVDKLTLLYNTEHRAAQLALAQNQLAAKIARDNADISTEQAQLMARPYMSQFNEILNYQNKILSGELDGESLSPSMVQAWNEQLGDLANISLTYIPTGSTYKEAQITGQAKDPGAYQQLSKRDRRDYIPFILIDGNPPLFMTDTLGNYQNEIDYVAGLDEAIDNLD